MKKTNFVIIKSSLFRDVKNFEYSKENGFIFKPLNNINKGGINVKKMVIVNESFVENILTRKTKKKLELYLRFIISILEDDSNADPTDLRAALNDLTRYKGIIENKYSKFLDEKYTKLLLGKINLLEKELKNRIIFIKEDIKEKEEELGKSR